MKALLRNRTFFPRLSRILVILHAGLAALIFFLVQASAGSYYNGAEWVIVAFIDFPTFLPLTYFSEGDSPLNPALMSDTVRNCFYFAYALVFGTIHWWAIGLGIQWLVRHLSTKR